MTETYTATPIYDSNTIWTIDIGHGVSLSDNIAEAKLHVTTLEIDDSITLSDFPLRDRPNYNFYEKLIAFELHIDPKIPINVVSALELFEIDSSRIGTITDWHFSPDYRTLFNDGGGYATTSWHNCIQSYGKITKTSKHWAGEYTVGNLELELNDPESGVGSYGDLYGNAYYGLTKYNQAMGSSLYGTALYGTGLYGTAIPSYGTIITREYKSIWGSLYSAGSEARGKVIAVRAMIQDRPLTYVSQFEGQIQDIIAENGKINILIQDKLGGLNDKQFVWDYANIGSSNGQHVWGRVKAIVGTQVMWDDLGDVEYIERKSPETTFWDTAIGAIVGGALGLVSGGIAPAILGFTSGALNNLPKNSKVTNAYYKYTDYNAIPDDTVASGQKVKFYAGSICAIATNSNSPLKNLQEYVISGGNFENGIYGTFSFADTSGIKVDDWVYVRQPITFGGSPDTVIKQILCGSNINIPYNAEITHDQYGNLIHESSFSALWNEEIQNLELLSLNRVIGVDDEISPMDLLKELFSEIKVNFYIDENNKFACRTIRPRGFGLTNIATYTYDTNIMNFQYKRSSEEIQNGFVMYYDHVAKDGAYKGNYNKKLVINFKNPIANTSKFGTIESKWISNENDAKTIGYRVMFDTERGVDRGVLDTTLYGIIQNTADIIRVTHPTGSTYNRLFEIESYTKNFDSSKVQFNIIDAERLYGYGNCAWATTFDKVTNSVLSGYSIYGHIAGQAGTFGSLSGSISSRDETISVNSPNVNYQGWYACFGSLSNQYTEIVFIQSIHPILNKCILKRGLFNTIQRSRVANDNLYTLAPASYDDMGNLTPFALTNKFNLGTTFNINTSFGTGFKFF